MAEDQKRQEYDGTFLSEAKDLLASEQVLRLGTPQEGSFFVTISHDYSGFLTIIFLVYRTPSTVSCE